MLINGWAKRTNQSRTPQIRMRACRLFCREASLQTAVGFPPVSRRIRWLFASALLPALRRLPPTAQLSGRGRGQDFRGRPAHIRVDGRLRTVRDTSPPHRPARNSALDFQMFSSFVFAQQPLAGKAGSCFILFFGRHQPRLPEAERSASLTRLPHFAEHIRGGSSGSGYLSAVATPRSQRECHRRHRGLSSVFSSHIGSIASLASGTVPQSHLRGTPNKSPEPMTVGRRSSASRVMSWCPSWLSSEC